MKAQDTLAPVGYLTLRIYEHGELVDTIAGKNLVTTVGREAISRALGSTPNKAIVEFGAGTSSAAPTIADTSLTSPFTKAIASVAFPTSGKVVFSFEMTTAEGNGVTYQEWGLLCDDGTLFSRKTSVAIVKTNAIAIQGEWSIEIP